MSAVRPNPAPRSFRGVMVSSTFTDLKEHRQALIQAIDGQSLKPVVMENDSAKPGVDVIDSSLQMVRDASAYVGLISLKYGQIPDSRKNPDNLSLTELEFNEAVKLERPILLFIMGKKHPVLEEDIELDCSKREKLNAFRERAKEMGSGSKVHRVYAMFESLQEFGGKAIQSVAELRRYLDEQSAPAAQPQPEPPAAKADPIPSPPAFYAAPPYIGSHQFVGRRAELDRLSDWALAADPHPVLLFEAIGGSGKSMLTWEWTTKHANQVRTDWAGCFWYSFYEHGAVMADFCGRALAYVSGQPLDGLKQLKTPELSERLLHHLRTGPWLFVLDGLERVLVAYHRFDAAQLSDEEANRPTDQIAQRDPCAAIRPEDDDLLRSLTAAGPSKVLITTRLTPRVLLNSAGQPIPGVLRVPLPGLRPSDAESLLRSCAVDGDSQAIQNYLKTHCDCHPLVTGVLAGLINDYLPDRGNFDAWVADPQGGRQLNLADLDLVQKRNHILKAALDALSERSREFLSIMGLLYEAVDYATLAALNSDSRREELSNTVRDLQHRGLLQYDAQTKCYDLHPVVRSVAAGGLRREETESYGQRVVDYFSAQAHKPYDDAETLEDIRATLDIVRTLLKMGRYQKAFDAYSVVSNPLTFNLEAHAETLSVLRPFFRQGWANLPDTLDEDGRSQIGNEAAIALENTGALEEASTAYGAGLKGYLTQKNWTAVRTLLANISHVLQRQGRLARLDRSLQIALDIAISTANPGQLFRALLDRFRQLSMIGQSAEAQLTWDRLDTMGRDWPRSIYRPGDAEYEYALFRFRTGQLADEDLIATEELARAGKNRTIIRYLQGLRGQWRIERGEWELAAESLKEAVAMARAVGQSDPASETRLVLARFQLGQLPEPRAELEQLASAPWVSLALAELWLVIGEPEPAKKHARAAYIWAWADGEPYVHRYELNKARALLEKLGAEIPNLPPYDPAKDPKLPWEDELAAAIEELRAEKQAAS